MDAVQVVVSVGRNKINRLSMKTLFKINGGRKVIRLVDSKDKRNELNVLNVLGDRQQTRRYILSARLLF